MATDLSLGIDTQLSELRTMAIQEMVRELVIGLERGIRKHLEFRQPIQLDENVELFLQRVIEELWTKEVGPSLDEELLQATLKDYLPSGLATRVRSYGKGDLRLLLHGPDEEGMYWHVYQDVQDTEAWAVELINVVEGVSSIACERTLSYGVLSPTSKAPEVAKAVLETIGWPHYPFSKTHMPGDATPRSLTLDGSSHLFNSGGI
jgi:hypothetical protein